MTIEATLAAILREQREMNALLRRLVEAKTGVPVPQTVWVSPPTYWGSGQSQISHPPPHIWDGENEPGFVSPVTTGDGGTIRVGWQGNGMVGP